MLTSESSGEGRQTQHFSVLGFPILCFILLLHTRILVAISVAYRPAGILFGVGFFTLIFEGFLSNPLYNGPCTVAALTALPCGRNPKKA